MSDDSATQQSSGSGLIAILTAIQRGVTAINNMTQAMKLVFPSS